MGVCFHMHESQYTSAIHKQLPKHIHRWKINARFANGVPDAWYSGNKSDIWIEYKLVRTNKKILDPTKLLSALQQQWLRKRYAEGRKVAVVVGTPKGSIILTDKMWEAPQNISDPNFIFLTKKEVADWIAKECSTPYTSD